MRRNDAMVVWELDRPVPSLAEIPQIQEETIDDVIDSVKNMDDHSMRMRIIHIFKLHLSYEEGTTGRPFNAPGRNHLWEFLRNQSIRVVHELYRRTMDVLNTANQYVVDHNVVL